MERDEDMKNENLRDLSEGSGNDSKKNEFHNSDNPGSDNINRPKTVNNNTNEDLDNTDKYLAMEQQGVTYTHDNNPVANSDNVNPYERNKSDEWNEEGGNSSYSDAFNQDDYILNDNLDLDEDQNQSISSDDEDFEETNERY